MHMHRGARENPGFSETTSDAQYHFRRGIWIGPQTPHSPPPLRLQTTQKLWTVCWIAAPDKLIFNIKIS